MMDFEPQKREGAEVIDAKEAPVMDVQPLPAGWRQIRLSECCEIIAGSTPKREKAEYWGGDIAWATPKDLSNLDSPILEDTPEHITEQGYRSCSTTMLPRGSVLFSSRAPIGLVAITGRDMCTNQGFKSLVPGEDVDSRYLYHLMKRIAPQIQDMGRGATFKEVSKELMAEIVIPLPTKSDQTRIAVILDKADAIHRKRQQAIQLADEFLRSVFLDTFGDPVANTKRWPTYALSHLGRLARGKSKHRPRNDPVLLGGPYPLIQTGDVAQANHFVRSYTQTYSEVGLKQSKIWPRGTLCITIAANIADTAILTFDACFPDSIVGFTPSEQIRTEYIHMWLWFYQRILRDKAPESAQKNINLEILSKLDIPLPPSEQQGRFVEIFNAVEKSKSRMRDSEDDITNTFASLNQRAFRGEL